MARFAGSFDRPSQIPLEILEAEPLLVDKIAIEGPFDQNFQFAQPEHRNCALPALPDMALRLRLQLHEGIAEKSACQGPVKLSLQHHHGEHFAHARSDELLGLRIEDDVVERLRIRLSGCWTRPGISALTPWRPA